MSKKLFAIAFVVLLLAWPAADTFSQRRTYSLFEIVQLARTQSPSWLRAETRKENNYWLYRTYLSNYNPQLSLQGTLPNYTRSFVPVTQPDGAIVYRPVEQNNVDLAMNLSQQIGRTGGTLFAGTTMNRFDDFINDTQQYSGDPLRIGWIQPIFQFNQLLWDRRIRPLEYEESQKEYFEDLENIAVNSTQTFFDLLLAQMTMQIARTNVANNDTIYKIAQGRFQLGKIGENELLQLELNLVNSQLEVAQAEVDLQSATLNLKSFIGLLENEEILLEEPSLIPDFEVDEQFALSEARKNRADPVAFQRRVYEGQQGVALARGNNGVNMDLFASYGLSNQGQSVSDVYTDPVSATRVSLQMNIPIVDWGRQKSRRKTAEANLKLIEYQVAQDEINFDQEVLTQVRNYKLLRNQVAARKKSQEIGQQAYDIAYQLFLIGKISITDLNQSLASKDNANRAYIIALRDYWTAYFQLRRNTLYDFETDTLLVRDLDLE